MESVLAFLTVLTLSSLLLFTTSSVAARKDPAEYWKDVMKDQPMPEAIQGLLHSNNPGSLSSLHEKQKQEENNSDSYLQRVAGLKKHKEEEIPRKEFELNKHSDLCHDAAKQEEEQKKKSFVKDFDPTPNISVYSAKQEEEDKKKSFVKDFDPTPNISVYNE